MGFWNNIFRSGERSLPAPVESVEERSVTPATVSDGSGSVASTRDSAEEFVRKLGLDELHVSVTPRNAMSIAAFYGCVRFICNILSSLPYTVYRSEAEGGSKKFTEHPLHWVLTKRANRHMSPFIAHRTMLMNCLVYGWSIAEIKRDYLRRVTEIIPYPCSKVFILHDVSSDEFYFKIPHLNKTLFEDDVIWLKDLSFDGNWGGSIVAWQAQTIKINLLAKQFEDKFLSKSTFVGGIIESGDAKNEDAAKIIKKRMVEGLQDGDDGGFGLVVLSHGTKFTKVGMTPVESQLNELFNHSAKEIAMMFGLPLSVLGNTEVQSSWGTGVEQMFIALTNSVLIPIATQFEQELDYKCLRKDEILAGIFTRHNFKGLLKGDQKAQAEYYTKMAGAGFFKLDEVRDLEEMDKLPDGTGATAYMNGSNRPLALLGKEFKQSKNNKKSNGNEDSASES
nr:phage portal protein [Dyadobacter fermentans]